MTSREAPLPVGEPVADGPAERPPRAPLVGDRVSLEPLDPDRDGAELYACSHGSEATERLWTYMGYGPFADAAAMRDWLQECASTDDPLFLAVVDRGTGRPVGMVSFARITPAARCLEIAHIWYAPTHQRGVANPEAVYLMLREAFERWGYRRVEWKCDALNARSRRAAERLGFRFEGEFRKHLIVKGRNRDTAWYAMLDDDWPQAKAALQRQGL